MQSLHLWLDVLRKDALVLFPCLANICHEQVMCVHQLMGKAIRFPLVVISSKTLANFHVRWLWPLAKEIKKIPATGLREHSDEAATHVCAAHHVFSVPFLFYGFAPYQNYYSYLQSIHSNKILEDMGGIGFIVIYWCCTPAFFTEVYHHLLVCVSIPSSPFLDCRNIYALWVWQP